MNNPTIGHAGEVSAITFNIGVDFLRCSYAHQLLLAGAVLGLSVDETPTACSHLDRYVAADQIENLEHDGAFKFYILPLIGFGFLIADNGMYAVTEAGFAAIRLCKPQEN